MSSTCSTYRNQYLSASFLKHEDNYALYALEVLEPFPSFFFFPILEISAQMLTNSSAYAIVVPTESGLSGVLLSLGYREIKFTQDVGYTVTPATLTHQIPYGATDYFSFVSFQERFYFGLSRSDWMPKKPQHNMAPAKIEKCERVNGDFDWLIEERKSATQFSEASKLKKQQFDSVLLDCFYVNDQGRMPTGTAGGFQHFEIYLVTSSMEDCPAGVYSILPSTRQWIQIDSNDYVQSIWEVSFSQEYTKDCSNYFIFVLNLTEMKDKYGSRSHRFSLLGLGGLLDRMHLSCTSYGLNYRTIGGFDEGILKALLKINDDNRIIGAIAALG